MGDLDILPDGSLDLSNEFLEEFDFVVASIHTRFGQDNTYRILRAIKNPYVNLIGHLINLAKETGTALELNKFKADPSPENGQKVC